MFIECLECTGLIHQLWCHKHSCFNHHMHFPINYTIGMKHCYYVYYCHISIFFARQLCYIQVISNYKFDFRERSWEWNANIMQIAQVFSLEITILGETVPMNRSNFAKQTWIWFCHIYKMKFLEPSLHIWLGK